MDEREFKNPSKIYRPSPFWSWNDELSEGELRWQIREFADKGFGGYFMHARVGLATPYLSDEWMNCIRACLDEGRRENLESWLYDEDKWPSGFAGGLVPAESDEYRIHFLTMERAEAEDLTRLLKEEMVQAFFEISLSSGRIENFIRISKPEDFSGKGRLFVFKVKAEKRGNNRFNGETYVNLLNPEVTREFIKVTLDAYAERFREHFGEYMPGIFTDEPNYAMGNYVPWSRDLPEYFRKLNGYDLLDKLPLLYFKGEGYYKVRHDFWKTVTLKFVESYTKIYAERCEEYGLELTGHVLCEDNLNIQIRRIGAAMPHYEYMQIPGIDHLGRNIDNPLTLKQCSSVAHQFGRTRILSELFGCSGHSMTFEDQKWIGDFHLALGITFFCPHLTLYTMKGEAKRDYPPTFSYHQPYWRYFKFINDYFARASYMCSRGEFQAYILLLHPISSAWATFDPLSEKPNPDLWSYNQELIKLQEILLGLHWDFDYGDEIIISKHGYVENGRFIVNKSAYRVVIVPPSLTWFSSTINLLEKFLESGGRIIFVGETPRLIDAEPAEERWRRILTHPNVKKTENEAEAVSKAFNAILDRAVSIIDEKGREIRDILVHHRIEGMKHIYFMTNTSRRSTYDAAIKFSQIGEVTEWDLFNGKIFRVKAASRNGKTLVKTTFYPAGSHVFVIDASKPQASEEPLPTHKVLEKTEKIPDEWKSEPLDLNSFVIDSCEYRFNDEEWRPKTSIWKIRRRAWMESGLGEYIGIQPWVLKKRNIRPPRSLKIDLRAHFRSEVKPKQIFLVIEKASAWSVKVNGVQVSTETSEWHWDKQFKKINITDHIKVGENIIELLSTFDWNLPIENLYVVGRFGVKKISSTEYMITDEPARLRDGSWVEQGYPFYTGIMRYKSTFIMDKKPEQDERVLIRLPEARGVLFLVSVNSSEPKPICWRPLEADVTDDVRKGLNEITIDVVGSLRNTFGPLHHKAGDLYIVEPSSFTDEKNWTDKYQLVPYGLTQGVELVIQKISDK
ncbi:hypothetical protein DRO35_01835 [Candidatus Bathyarchaeota archaeon]|nr:MAG: hypothetical protein DRO35_01835 [Candidatus Bathyarchaeota archaeon]